MDEIREEAERRARKLMGTLDKYFEDPIGHIEGHIADSLESAMSDSGFEFEENPLWWNLIGIGFLLAGLILVVGISLIALAGGIALFRWAIS